MSVLVFFSFSIFYCTLVQTLLAQRSWLFLEVPISPRLFSVLEFHIFGKLLYMWLCSILVVAFGACVFIFGKFHLFPMYCGFCMRVRVYLCLVSPFLLYPAPLLFTLLIMAMIYISSPYLCFLDVSHYHRWSREK